MTSPTPAQRLGEALRAITDNGDAGQVVALAREYGIDGRLARRAAKNIEVNASAYVQLCAAVGIDPVTGKPAPREQVPEIDWRLVSAMALMVLINTSLSIRKAASRWKLSPAALVRLREGEPVSVENFLAFCAAPDIKAKPSKFRARSPMFHGKQAAVQVEHP
ncbi:MAG: hypothetical protein Q8M26_08840 [Pseudolabrys sp.]|nr:hypothetical protein [Pseudolabrys sp.]